MFCGLVPAVGCGVSARGCPGSSIAACVRRHARRMAHWPCLPDYKIEGWLNLRAALTARNGRSVRAGLRVVKERADLFRHFRAERVFDPASVIVNHVLVDSKGFAEQALGEAMPPHHVL